MAALFTESGYFELEILIFRTEPWFPLYTLERSDPRRSPICF